MKEINKIFICLFIVILVLICNCSEIFAKTHKDTTQKTENLGVVKLSSSSQANTHTDIFFNNAIDQRKNLYNELKKHKSEPCFKLTWEMTNMLFTKALMEILADSTNISRLDTVTAKREVIKLNNDKESIKVFANSKDGACRGKLELTWNMEEMSYLTDLTVKCQCAKAPTKGATCSKENYPSIFKYFHGSIVELQRGKIVGRVFGTKIVETKILTEEKTFDCCDKRNTKPEDAQPKPQDPKTGEGKKLFGTDVRNCQDCFKLKVKIHQINQEIAAKQKDIQDLKDFNRKAETTIKNNNIKLEVLKKGRVVYIYENSFNGKLMTSQGKPLQDYQLPPNFVFKGTGEFPHRAENKKTEKDIADLEKENKELEGKIKANEAMISIIEDMIKDSNTELKRLNNLLKKCLTVCMPEDKVGIAIPEPTVGKEDKDLVKTCRCKEIQYNIRDLKQANKAYKKEHNKDDLPDYKKQMEQLKSDYSACNTLCKPEKQPRVGLSINFGFLFGGRGRSHRPVYNVPQTGCH